MSPGGELAITQWSSIAVQMHNSDSGYERYIDDWEDAAEFNGFALSKLRGFIYEESRNIFDTLAAFIAHGVLERFSGVRIGVVENGGSWAHRLLDVFDRVYRKRPYDFSEHPEEVCVQQACARGILDYRAETPNRCLSPRCASSCPTTPSRYMLRSNKRVPAQNRQPQPLA